VEYVSREEKVARINELRDGLTGLAEEFPGVLPEDAQARWDNDNKEIDGLRADVAALDARRDRIAALAGGKGVEPAVAPAVIVRKTEADIFDLGAIYRTARTPEDRDQALRDNAMRATETMRFAHPDADADTTRAKIADLLDYKDSEDKELARRIITTGSPQYRRDFNRYVKSGGQERGTALAVGVDGTGGFSVPVAFDPTIVAFGVHTAINPYRRACRVETIVGTDTWQALSATAITAAYALEAAVVNEQGPTFTRPEYIVKRAQAFVSASYEMMQDRADLAAELGVLFQEAKDNVEEQKFAIGAAGGVTPVGMFVDGQYTAIETIGNNVVAAGDAYALEAGLPVRHRMNAAWFMGRGAIRHFQGLETAMGILFNGINYANAGSLDTNAYGNTGLKLLGYPVWESPSAPVTMTTNAAIVAVLTDPKSYVIVDRVGMSVRVIPDLIDQATGLPTGQSGIFAFWRNTAARLNVDAGRQMKVNAP
jgi:HK97 family phage major capsid protein